MLATCNEPADVVDKVKLGLNEKDAICAAVLLFAAISTAAQVLKISLY